MLRRVAVFVVAWALSACGGGATSTSAPATAPPPVPSSTAVPSQETTDSLGHEDAALPVDPGVSLPSYGYYALLQDPPTPAAHLMLTDQRGKLYHFDPTGMGMDGTQIEDPPAVTLLYFGYTHCPDLCPSELATIATALDDLPNEIADQIRMIFVTVDPARDDVARMREYVHLFDPTFIGLTGSEEAIFKAQVDLGLKPAKKIPSGDGEYAMSHTAEVLAFTPDGRAHLTFPFGMTTVEWEHDLWKLVQFGWKEAR